MIASCKICQSSWQWEFRRLRGAEFEEAHMTDSVDDNIFNDSLQTFEGSVCRSLHSLFLCVMDMADINQAVDWEVGI